MGDVERRFVSSSGGEVGVAISLHADDGEVVEMVDGRDWLKMMNFLLIRVHRSHAWG